MAKDQLSLTAIVRGDRIGFSDWQQRAILEFLKNLDGKPVTATYARPKNTRSLQANAYLWSAVYPAIAEYTGMTTEDVHEWVKDEFLPRRFITLAGKEKEIRKTTVDLSVKEFGEFIERIIAWAAQEFGLMIPVPT